MKSTVMGSWMARVRSAMKMYDPRSTEATAT